MAKTLNNKSPERLFIQEGLIFIKNTLEDKNKRDFSYSMMKI